MPTFAMRFDPHFEKCDDSALVDLGDGRFNPGRQPAAVGLSIAATRSLPPDGHGQEDNGGQPSDDEMR
jgi:hypothetical protein